MRHLRPLTVIAVLSCVVALIMLSEHRLAHTNRVCTNCHSNTQYSTALTMTFHGRLGCLSCHRSESFWYRTAVALLPPVLTRHEFYHDHFHYDSALCLANGCHDIKSIRVSSGATYPFSHETHFASGRSGEKQLKCASCHYDVAHIDKTARKTMGVGCFLCHPVKDPNNGNECRFCHAAFLDRSRHRRDRCASCHSIDRTDVSIERFKCLFCHKEGRSLGSAKEYHETHAHVPNAFCLDCHKNQLHHR